MASIDAPTPATTPLPLLPGPAAGRRGEAHPRQARPPHHRGFWHSKALGAGLVLASDGAYPLSDFGREARRAFEAGPMQEALGAWLGSQGLSNDDDATVALLRRSQIAAGDRPVYEEALREGSGFRERGLAAHLMLKVAFEKVDRGLADKAPEVVRQGLVLIESGRLRPGRERLLEVVDRIAESDLPGRKALFSRALALARKQPF